MPPPIPRRRPRLRTPRPAPALWPSTLRPAPRRRRAPSPPRASTRWPRNARAPRRMPRRPSTSATPGWRCARCCWCRSCWPWARCVADGAGAWPRAAGGVAFAGLGGTLLWLVLVCALRAPLRRLAAPARGPWRRWCSVRAAALAGLLPLWWLALRRAARRLARAGGVALAGAGLAGAAVGLAGPARAHLGSRSRPACAWPSCSRASGRTSCSTR